MESKNILIVLGIIVVAYLLFSKTVETERKSISVLAFDAEGNLIDTIQLSRGTDLQSVYVRVDEMLDLPPNTATIKFQVTVENTGNVPLTATYSGMLEKYT